MVASDAALEKASGGSGGFLIVWLQDGVQVREGFVADIPEGIYALWSPGDKKIAQLELLMVLYGLVNRPSQFKGRRGIWFIDNIAALMSLIRGRSSSPDLDRISSMIHVALFALRCWAWWEYIPSKSNWSDSISRLGFGDPWHVTNQFSSQFAFFPLVLWEPLSCLSPGFRVSLSASGMKCVGPGDTRASLATNCATWCEPVGTVAGASQWTLSYPKH